MIKITDKQNCCGCSACGQRCPKQCITMEEDNEGFLYPKVNTSLCIDCHLCEKVCPVINQNEIRKPLNVYAAINPEEELRQHSSSGGIFTMLAEHIIDEDGVVFGAVWDNNWNVKHSYTESKIDLQQFRSSKYLQSIIGNSYQQAELFLKAGRKVMFTGTPCQIAGLLHFLRKPYINLLTVDVICHSVPSPGVWQQYLSEKMHSLKWKKQDISQISFRNKQTGWKSYSFVIERKNSDSYSELGSRNPFMQGFIADLYTRPSCIACPAKQLKSGSDITLGDFWGINTLKSELDDDKGVSAVTVNTLKGKEALLAVDANLYDMSYEELIKRNPSMVRSASMQKKRNKFFEAESVLFEVKVKKLTAVPFSCRRIINNIALSLKKYIKQILKRILSKKY